MGKRKRNIAVYDSYTVCVREGAGTEGEGEKERERACAFACEGDNVCLR